MSNQWNILQAVAAQVAILGLAFEGTAIPLTTFKAPRARPRLDTLPMLIVAPGQTKKVRERAWLDNWWVPYGVSITLIVQGNLDMLTGVQSFSDWREAVAARFEDPRVLGLNSIRSIEVNNEVLLDLGTIPAGLDVSSVGLEITALESQPG